MIFDKLQVKTHASHQRCLVHLVYGTEEDEATRDKIYAALERAKIQTIVDRHEPTLEHKEKLLQAFGSFCFEVKGATHAGSTAHDGRTISFYTDGKDAKDKAKAAFAELKADGITFSTPLTKINDALDKQYALENRAK